MEDQEKIEKSNSKQHLNKRKKARWLLQDVETKEFITNPALLPGNFVVTDLRKAKRLLSKLISEFIKGGIDNRDAKDLAYLVSVLITAIKEVDIEARIKALEENIKTQK